MRKKGLFSMLVCTCLCVILTAGCSAPQNSGSPSPTAPSETGAGSTGGVETPLQTDGGENYIPPDWQYDLNVEEDMQYSYNIEDQFIPFWERNVMYNESACFIEENGVISAKLLCTPESIISVRDWSLQNQYVEGKDYIWDEGTKTLIRPEGSSIP